MDVGKSLPLHRLLQDSRIGNGGCERQDRSQLYVSQARNHREDSESGRVQAGGEDALNTIQEAVIPAKLVSDSDRGAGIQANSTQQYLDSRVRGHDKKAFVSFASSW